MIEPGALLQNRYRVLRQVGQGGMGAVYVATDERFHSTVAVKQTFFDDPQLRRAFEREAQLLNHLRHAALPKVSDHFIEGDGQFLVMEFIEGDDLSDLLERHGGAFPVAQVLQWADELLDALDYLHTQQQPIIHRDIKPQNLKLTARGQIVLLDFGLAKGTTTQTHASVTASVFGYSRNYAPLEQIQGTGTNARSDLYSLGATLYHLLTGEAPVDALTRASAIINNQPDPLVPAQHGHAHVPAAVGDVLHRAMAQSAAGRPQSAAEMRAALRQAASTSADTARQAPTMVVGGEGQTARDEATLVEANAAAATTPPKSILATRPAAPANAQPQRVAPPQSEVTVTLDAAARAPRRPTRTYVPQPAPVPTPARRSPKLFVAAAVLLLVACAAIPFVLNRSAATPVVIDAGSQTGMPAQLPTDATAAPSAATQPQSPNATTNASLNPEPTYAQPNTPAARSAAPANAAQSAPDDARATGSADAGDGRSGAAANDSSPAAGVNSSGRGTLEIHNPVPSPTPFDERAERERIERAERARAEEEARRAEDLRRRQMGPPPPPDGRFPPPQEDGFRPPPRRPPPGS